MRLCQCEQVLSQRGSRYITLDILSAHLRTAPTYSLHLGPSAFSGYGVNWLASHICELCAPDPEVISISETTHVWRGMTETTGIETDQVVELCP